MSKRAIQIEAILRKAGLLRDGIACGDRKVSVFSIVNDGEQIARKIADLLNGKLVKNRDDFEIVLNF